MKIENTFVYGFEAALRGMRNARDSHNRADSKFNDCAIYWGTGQLATCTMSQEAKIGPNDLSLACRLIRAGSEHRKFLREIWIWADLTLPRYLWQEWDTYKVATTRLSESSMDLTGKRILTLEDFEDGEKNKEKLEPRIVDHNECVLMWKETLDLEWIRKAKQLLPESFLQKSTVNFNYETALTILRQRHNHRLKEWRLEEQGSICEWLLSLPYMKEFYEALTEKKENIYVITYQEDYVETEPEMYWAGANKEEAILKFQEMTQTAIQIRDMYDAILLKEAGEDETEKLIDALHNRMVALYPPEEYPIYHALYDNQLGTFTLHEFKDGKFQVLGSEPRRDLKE